MRSLILRHLVVLPLPCNALLISNSSSLDEMPMLCMAFDNALLCTSMMHLFDGMGQGLDTTSISFDPVQNDFRYELNTTNGFPL
jgi:hypothetical protein